MALRRIQSGMVSRFADINFDNGTVFGNLSVAGSVSATNISGQTGGSVNPFYPYQVFDANGVQTTFTLASAAPSVNDILVFVSGVYQNKSQYYLSDNFTLNLVLPPPSGAQMLEVAYIRGFSNNVDTFIPADNTVITSKIADGAVTTAKLADGAVTYEKLSASYAILPVQTFTGDGTTTIFNLVSAVSNVNEINVFISGVYQNKNTYSILPNPKSITFSEAPPNTQTVEIAYLRGVPSTTNIPPDNSITTSQIMDGAVTSSKLGITDLTIPGNLTVLGSITAFGEMTYIDTAVSTTSALSVINVGTGPALVVRQKGNEPVAEFYDQESGSVLFLANNGQVGIGTNNPGEELTVVGTISSTDLKSSQAVITTISGTDIYASNNLYINNQAAPSTGKSIAISLIFG